MSQITPDSLSGHIYIIRGHRVLLDSDLARMYGVPTKRFNEAFKRNAPRFPADFAFQLTAREFRAMRSQIVTRSNAADGKVPMPTNWSQIATSSKASRRGMAYRPWAFTEHGAVMVANILRSARAVEMSVYVVRAFILQREMLATNGTILRRLAEIDKTLLQHDAALRVLWLKLRPLLQPAPEQPRKEMGFHVRMRKT
jgi:hypothetical protein